MFCEFLISQNTVKNVAEFAKEVEISNSMMTELAKKRSNVGTKVIHNSVLKYHLNTDWLYTGRGDMLKSDTYNNVSTKSSEPVGIAFKANDTDKKTVYLYDASASAGYKSFEDVIKSDNMLGKYVIPGFYNIDFMIHVDGSSMYPKYSNGDIIACRIIRESSFIQWGKVYVIATRGQGLLVKRPYPYKEDEENYIECRSDNERYIPFKVNKNEIFGMALVVGVIHLE